MPRPNGFWHLPGIVCDLAFGGMFRGLQRHVTRIIEKEGLYPWLDVCSGTGAQLRRQSWGPVPRVHVFVLGSDVSVRSIPDPGPDGSGLGRSNKQVYGLDLSFGFIRYAAARSPEVPFICSDAARLPFKDGSLRAVSVSFGLHDKSPELRSGILSEARRVLGPGGKLIAVDFENPWSARSALGMLFARAVERLAGREHFANGRVILIKGGLRGFLREVGFVEASRRDVAAGSLAIVVARPAS